MIKVTQDLVKQKILSLVDDTTSFDLEKYSSLDEAIEKLSKEKFSVIDVFEVLTQEMIDDQEDSHSGYLSGANVGDLVWGDDECWVSQLTVDGWSFHAEQALGKSHNDIDDIADYIENTLILEVLSSHNDK
ncbi:hypothetical protein [Vibrio phage ST2-1pr]|uniref:hypothetical protein n=1 Tax=Vibrio sp. St2 TaxID=2853441 RepID=UPI001C75CB83|nr:hypothetical protein [Vibrio sp. St2]QXM18779.1 hypothetical protein [Vibrio phage ST2-1pr]